MIRRLFNWIAERLAAPPDVSYNDAYTQALDYVSGPNQYWYCSCDNPWGQGRMLNGPEITHCEYCGRTAPWVPASAGTPLESRNRWPE